jgi:sensor domain CHASE-containing protein
MVLYILITTQVLIAIFVAIFIWSAKRHKKDMKFSQLLRQELKYQHELHQNIFTELLMLSARVKVLENEGTNKKANPGD